MSAGTSSGSSFTGHSGAAHFREVAKLGARIADALDYAHRQGVVHRDIKPSNILLDVWGNYWVTDFGLAKLTEEEEHSRSHDLVGTLRFMAPERFRGESDHRCDIYSLCATLYELIALRPAFTARDHAQLIEKIGLEPPQPLRPPRSRRVPRDLETIVQLAVWPRTTSTGLARRRLLARRTPSDFSTAARSGPVGLERLEQGWRWCKRNPWLAAADLSAASLVILLTIVSTMAARTHRAPEPSGFRFENAAHGKRPRQIRVGPWASHSCPRPVPLQRGGVIGQAPRQHQSP